MTPTEHRLAALFPQTIRRALGPLSNHRPAWIAALVISRFLPRVRRLWPDTLVSAAALESQIDALLKAWGMSQSDASITSAYLLYSDLHGIDSHGCSMLPYYHRRLLAGALTMTPQIEVVRDDATTALIDGGGGLGHVPGDTAMKMAIAKCHKLGISAVAVRNSGHYGAAGAYALMAAREGLIGLSTTSTLEPAIVPTFGLDAMLGTNPVAFAAPSLDRPFVLDMATSTASLGKIATQGYSGRAIPRGWALDARGKAVTRAGSAIRLRRLTPLGSTPATSSYKGYGLAAMVEVLSAVLPGTRASSSATNRPSVGHFFMAIDPRRFRDEGGFEADLSSLMEELRGTRACDPRQPVLVPGDPEYAAHAKRSLTGIPLTRSVIEELRTICQASGVLFTLEARSGIMGGPP
ncbi:MAG: Ldh family oxidoreductase [Anaerolineae bacterium]|nr:Ldh family oxidoreductase [Gemmatimonadaceae bacterium]